MNQSFWSGGAAAGARPRNWGRHGAWLRRKRRTRCIRSCRYRPRRNRGAASCRISRRPRAFPATCPLPRLVEELAADQHAADLAGAGADLIELGIAQQASGGKIIDVAVAAQGL